MTPSVSLNLSDRMALLERRASRLSITSILLFVALAGSVAIKWIPGLSAQNRSVDDILTVRGLIVVDEKGIERVRIGSPLPDPMSGGKRNPRRGVVSGILISDSDGDERGGYVTSDTNGDAFLTLDAKNGQQTIFVANRDGGANLAVWSGNNRNTNYVSVRAVPTPLIEIVQQGKRVFSAGGPDAFQK